MNNLIAQSDVYTISSGELIFSGANIQRNENNVQTDMRFTAFLHLGEYVHVDFNNFIGIYSGLALRNVGILTKDDENEIDNYEKVVRRSYNLGIPLAFKLGVLKKNIYLFGGGEYEMLFHYKEKYWIDGDKHKTSQWFSNKTNRFVPSLFAGVHFQGGMTVQFKYYLDDFLNDSYLKKDDDYTTFNESRVFYVSLCWQFRTGEFWKKIDKEFFEIASR